MKITQLEQNSTRVIKPSYNELTNDFTVCWIDNSGNGRQVFKDYQAAVEFIHENFPVAFKRLFA